VEVEVNKENLKQLVWIDYRLTNTLDELLTLRGLLNLMADEFEKIPNALNENTADNRVELLFNSYYKLSSPCIQELRKISIDLEYQIKKVGGTTIDPLDAAPRND
jgi:hypothetical protein